MIESTQPSSRQYEFTLKNGRKDSLIACVQIRGPIDKPDGLSHDQFFAGMRKLEGADRLEIELDCEGGSFFDNWVIRNWIRSLDVPTLLRITGQCSSCAVLLATAFDRVIMANGAVMRFHRVTSRKGDQQSADQTTGALAMAVADLSGYEIPEIIRWMNETKCFSAAECLERRLCDEIV